MASWYDNFLKQYGLFGSNTPDQQGAAAAKLKQLVATSPTVNGRPDWQTSSQEAQLQASVAQNHMDGGVAHVAAPIISAAALAAGGADAAGFIDLGGAADAGTFAGTGGGSYTSAAAGGEDFGSSALTAGGSMASAPIPDSALLSAGDIASGGAAASSPMTIAQALSSASKLAGIGSAVSGLASLGAGAIEAGAATSATDKSLALQEANFNTQQGNLAPYLAAAKPALAALTAGTSPGGQFESTFTPADFAANEDPGYGFDLSQGELALQRSAAANGTLNSGGTMKEAMKFGQGLASQEFGNAYGRFMTTRQNNLSNLATVAGLGQGATGQSVQAGNATAAGESGTTMAGVMAAGGATASGVSGASNAISGGLNNVGQYALLSSVLKDQTGSSYNTTPQAAA